MKARINGLEIISTEILVNLDISMCLGTIGFLMTFSHINLGTSPFLEGSFERKLFDVATLAVSNVRSNDFKFY